MLTVPLALFGLTPVGLWLFQKYGPRRAVIAILLIAWLLLPMSGYKIPFLPVYDKGFAASATAMIGVLLFDSKRLGSVRSNALDVPMVIWCLTPMATSIVNGLGPYDGLTEIETQVIYWGAPYFLGRMYLGSTSAMRDLSLGITIAAAVYVPLCLFEIRMSPQLHYIVYGMAVRGFQETQRLGGWRPTVFMQHGIALGLFMCGGALVCLLLWKGKVVRKVLGFRIATMSIVLVVVSVLCKSLGAILLMAVAFGVLTLVWSGRRRGPLFALLILVPLFMFLKVTGLWTGAAMVDVAGLFDADRAASLQSRVNSDQHFVAHALQSPLFGWGTWGRNFVIGPDGNLLSIPDAMWAVFLSTYGLSGLISWCSSLLLPVAAFWRRTPSRVLFSAEFVPAVAISILVVLFMADSLFNAMLSPLLPFAAGGLVSLASLRPSRRPGASPAGARIVSRPGVDAQPARLQPDRSPARKD